jgi:hypothetical protein
MNLTATNVGAATETITLPFTSTEFFGPALTDLSLNVGISGTVSGTDPAGSTLSLTGSVEEVSDQFVLLTPGIGSIGTFTTGSSVVVPSLGTPFTLSQTLVITLTSGTRVNYTATTGLTPAAVPLPAPLFATGIGALGLLGWRRKRKAQTIG